MTPRDLKKSPPPQSSAGQAFLETLIVLLVLMLLLFGFLQTALVFGEREILHHAASRAARSKAVGFNDWMAEKAARVASIPISGKLLADDLDFDDATDLATAELERIPFYLASENHAQSSYILDYEEWQEGTLGFSQHNTLLGQGTLSYLVSHDAPFHMPFSPILFPWIDRDQNDIPRHPLAAETSAGEHYRLYLK